MARALSIEPIVGDWFSSRGERFEVVAVDEDERTIEVQYADGTLAEIDVDDWALRSKSGELRRSEQPEDLSGAIDLESEEEHRHSYGAGYDDEASLRAGGLDELDLFE